MMRWIRVRKRYGANAALLALLIQFAVSFGHVHGGYIESPSAPAVGSYAAAASDGGSARVLFDTGSHEPFGYVCDVCVALNLLASAQTAGPPAVPIQLVFVAAVATLPAETMPAELRPVGFRSRAPPLA